MSYSEQTQFYNLPVYEDGDEPDILTDLNPAFRTIDTQMRNNYLEAVGARGVAESVDNRVDDVEGDISDIETTLQGKADASTVTNLATSVATNSSNITALQTDIDAIQDVIPANASANNQLITKEDSGNSWQLIESKTGSTSIAIRFTKSLTDLLNDGYKEFKMCTTETNYSDLMSSFDMDIQLAIDHITASSYSTLHLTVGDFMFYSGTPQLEYVAWLEKSTLKIRLNYNKVYYLYAR